MTIQSPELSRSQVRMDSAASDPACLPRIECGTSIDELAPKLIDLCSGNHSVAMVYRFLLKAQDHTEETARAEFVRFLRGELSERLLQDARRWVQEEQARAELDGLVARSQFEIEHELPLRGGPQTPAEWHIWRHHMLLARRDAAD